MRGRFGNRTSGHGIGQRNLNNHPLARVDRQAALEEEVRQIDKACREMNRGPNTNHLQRLPDIPYASIDAELQRRLSDAERSSYARNQVSSGRADFLSPVSSRTALPSPAYPSRAIAYDMGARLSAQSPPIPPANSPTNRSSTMVDGMREPGDYAAQAVDPMETDRSVGWSGVRNGAKSDASSSKQKRRLQIKEDPDLNSCNKSYALICLDFCGRDEVWNQSRLQPRRPTAENAAAGGMPAARRADGRTTLGRRRAWRALKLPWQQQTQHAPLLSYVQWHLPRWTVQHTVPRHT